MMILGLVVLMGASCNKTVGTEPIANTMPAPDATNQVEEMVVNNQPVKTVTVSYTDSGFSPSSITINVGDTVKFINNGTDSAVWPAAAPHPIHTSVPGFDSKKGLVAGGSYSFKFTKAETVKYHNHLNPSQFGTIVVQ